MTDFADRIEFMRQKNRKKKQRQQQQKRRLLPTPNFEAAPIRNEVSM
jgi:hypothetical protein